MSVSLDPSRSPHGGVTPEADTAGPARRAAAWARARRQWRHAPDLPWLHGQVAQRMAQRLQVIRQTPHTVLDWHAWAGQSRALLQAAYPNARWLAVETDAPSLERVTRAAQAAAAVAAGKTTAFHESTAPSGWHRRWAERWSTLWPRARSVGPKGRDVASDVGMSSATNAASPSAAAGTAAAAPPSASGLLDRAVAPASGELVWSNLGLHTESDPVGTLARWHAALAVDGFLMFSTFGPDTLKELDALWRVQGWGPAHQPFMDMHDWGDELVHAGFADPVMDQEVIKLSWADADAALAELRTLGRNAHPDRLQGLRGRAWRQDVRRALAELAGADGRITLSFEIIYGHAFRPLPRPRLAPSTTVTLDEMRSLVQSARRSD